jgi:hypothetical protein
MVEADLKETPDIFQQFPIYGLRKISGGSAPVPYHVYNGTALFIGGTAGLASVQALLGDVGLEPVRTTQGEALISLWVCNFTQSSLGAHKMLQASISVALEGALSPVVPQPLALLTTMLTMPQVGMYCLRTWTDEARVAIFQSELLGMDVHLAQGEFPRNPAGHIAEFEFWDVSNGETLVSAQIRERAYTAPRPALALLRRLGLSGFLQVSRQPRFSLRTVTPCGSRWLIGGPSGAKAEQVSQLFWQNQRAVTQFFNPQSDRMFLSDSVYPGVQFHPQFIERLEGFKMVYLLPGNSKG